MNPLADFVHPKGVKYVCVHQTFGKNVVCYAEGGKCREANMGREIIAG